MNAGPLHITVCVCTYRRPALLGKLLSEMERQVTEGRLTFSIVVVDNDESESAKAVVAEHSAKCAHSIKYCPEPRKNIALARNKALENAHGDFLAFIDDDEFPSPDWLLRLLDAAQKYSADAVLGPVKPHFETPPPQWVLRGKFCERPEFETGRKMKWSEGRTGNILLRRESLSRFQLAFDPKFHNGGEDMEFLRQAADCGLQFVWCNEAAVWEAVPAARLQRSYMLKRALMRGKNILKHPTGKLRLLATSAIAVPLYSLVLPALFVAGHHLFMKACISLFDHLGRLLAVAGLNPVRERDL